MTSAALPAPLVAPRAAPDRALAIAAIILFGFALRLPMLGNPIYEIDEQFYLLVGDRLLHGTLPYVDIWDRKPIGLFLIYAGCRLLGGTGIVQYQLVATAFATATAVLVYAMSRRVAGIAGATIAGCLYLVWLEIAEGGGGQAPVFYGLPVAGAAALLLTPGTNGQRARAFAAMALIGIAIQIKYTVMFEGGFFGLVAAVQAWRRRGVRAVPEIALLALTALAPTLLALAAYAAIGHGRAFVFANFTSIFLRGPSGDPAEIAFRMRMALLRMVPLGACALAGAWHLWRTDPRPEARFWRLFVLGWIVAAIGGFFALGVFYAHYLLPVFLPLSVGAAAIVPRIPLGPALIGFAAWAPLSNLHYPDVAETERAREQMAALVALVPPDVDRGCMEMFDGPPILYHLTHACTVTRYPFPDHLSAAMEAGATGIDPAAEVRRVLAVRPEVITLSDVDVRPPNRITFALMRQGLTRDYRLAGKARVDKRAIWVFVAKPRAG